MKFRALIVVILSFIICTLGNLKAQNNDFFISIALGAGNSGFDSFGSEEDEVSNIYYPVAGIQLQKRLNPKWALNIFLNIGMSGNKRDLNQPIGSATRIKSTSAFVSLALHPKYYFNKSFYASFGPEISYLIWSRGSAYNEDELITKNDETQFFHRTSLLVSSSLGISRKVGQSRKNAPVQIDALWFLEFRMKKGVTNILNIDPSIVEISSSILAFELVMGISFSSQN